MGSSFMSAYDDDNDDEKFVFVLHYARSTDIDDISFPSLVHLGGDRYDVFYKIKKILESVLPDDHQTIRAFVSLPNALEARDLLMHDKISEARAGVKKLLGLNASQWEKVSEASWVCEYSDEQTHHFGVKYVGPKKPTYHQEPAYRWANRSTTIGAMREAFIFKDAEHNTLDNTQVHYELSWGSLSGCDACKVDPINILTFCDEILTRIRCWVQKVPIL